MAYQTFADLCLSMGALAAWDMTEPAVPFMDAGPGEHHITELKSGYSAASEPLIPDHPGSKGLFIQGAGETVINRKNELVAAINNAQGVTFLVCLRPTGDPWIYGPSLMRTSGFAGLLEFDYRPSFRQGLWYNGRIDNLPAVWWGTEEMSIAAVAADATHDYLLSDGAIAFSGERSNGAWVEVTGFEFIRGGGPVFLGYAALFPRALSVAEFAELYRQRLFRGRISGRVALDGAPSTAKIRAFRRTDGALAGESQAAEDGTYELIVHDNVQVDLLAIPPDGAAARPLAHGPILPQPDPL